MLNEEKLKAFPIKSGMRQGFQMSYASSIQCLKISQSNKGSKINKRDTNRRDKFELCLLEDLKTLKTLPEYF
jgi:hypothetical protein